MNKSIFEITYKIAVSVFVSFVLLLQVIVSLGAVVGIGLGAIFCPTSADAEQWETRVGLFWCCAFCGVLGGEVLF